MATLVLGLAGASIGGSIGGSFLGIAAATILAAVESGADIVDAAMDSFSGNTSQPCLGSIVEALRGSDRDSGLDAEWIRKISFYWEAVREQYVVFESISQSPASEVYLHEMPGGQFTNLKAQLTDFAELLVKGASHECHFL